MYFYAFCHHYGANMTTTQGEAAGHLVRGDKASIAAWVAAGSAYRTEAGYREAVTVAEARRMGHDPRNATMWGDDYDSGVERILA
jgi:hypothetical protein